jgi:hypothetical protein
VIAVFVVSKRHDYSFVVCSYRCPQRLLQSVTFEMYRIIAFVPKGMYKLADTWYRNWRLV